MMATRAGLGQPLIQAGDEIGVVLKSTPYPGTATGAGGYLTFYVPVGTQVVKAEYMAPNAAGTLVPVPIKGEAINPVGAGPNGQKTTPELIGLNLGPNVLGVTEAAVTAAGAHRGTIAGVYADTGIFYSTDPRTVFRSWEAAGGYDGNPLTNDNTITNNSGDAVIPITQWDAEQLLAYGARSPAIAIVDPGDQRGNAPWGLANGVAGPQSGYAWEFRRSIWQDTATYPVASDRMKAAVSNVGPWKRIKYPGSQASRDQAGLISTTNGYAATDASSLGVEVTPGSPLPPTISASDDTSPKAVRISFGELELGRSEYGRVTLRILGDPGDPGSPFDIQGKFRMFTDAFGGDAGGEQGGKDHLWRYYYPTTATIDTGAALLKDASKDVLAPNENFTYTLRAVNSGSLALSNVIITDPLPSGVSYISATPAPNTTSPLTWNLGTLAANSVVTLTINAKATGSGTLFNTATLTSDTATASATDSIYVGLKALLNPTKTVTPSSTAPGGTVTYTLQLENTGSGPNGTPLVITELLPAGFAYTGMVSQQINGGLLPGASLSVNSTNPNRPVFSISQGINAGSNLVLRFTCAVSGTQPAGTYENKISYAFEGKTLASAAMAPVTVGGARIGDTVFRDWDADGLQDAGEEGIANVSVQLWDNAGTSLLSTTTTDAAGNYLFTGLTANTYQIRVVAPADYNPTADPDFTLDDRTNVTITAEQEWLTADFGYQHDSTSVNSASIGDFVFADDDNNGTLGAQESGIPNVTVNLYEDSNANGIVDSGDLLIETVDSADGVADDLDGDTEIDPPGFYVFSGLDPSLRYIVDVDASDPDIDAFFSNAYTQSTNDRVAVSGQTAGDFFDSADFGFFGIDPASVGDQVFIDADGDGIFDAGDTGLANITVELYADADADGIADPGELVTSTATDASGVFGFTNLGPAPYIVKVLSTDPDLPAGTIGTVVQHEVTLTAGQVVVSADFPYVRQLSKAVDKAAAQAGETLLYTMRPYQPGSGLLSNVIVSDPIPSGTTYNGSAAPVPISQPPIGGTGFVVWNLGTTTAASTGSGTTPAYNPTGVIRQTTAEVEDTWIDENNVTDTNGNDNAGRTSPEANKRKVWLTRFSLPSLAATDVIDRAYVRVRVNAGRTSSHAVSLYRITTTTTWTEAGANWNDPNGGTAGDWLSPGGVFGTSDYDAGNPLGGTFSAPHANERELEFDVTNLVRSWRDGTLPNNGFVLVASGTDTGDVTFYSSEGGTAGTEPGPRLILGLSSTGQATNATVLDGFGSSNYGLNTGTKNWMGPWFETGDDGLPNGGDIRIASSRLQVEDSTAANIQRSVDLAGATSATLEFNIISNTLNSPSDQIAVQASNNGGSSWVTLQTYTQGSSIGAKSFNLITALGSVNDTTRIRFARLANGGGTGKLVVFDDVKITFSTPPGPATSTALVADTALLTTTRNVTITMTATSSVSATVTPPANLTTTVTGGASATKISGPTPAAGTADAAGATFAWVYQVSAGASAGSVRFSGAPTGPAGFSFGSASSQSVLATPPLTFRAVIDTPAPTSLVTNTATITDGNGLNATASATTATSASIGDLVWQDTNPDGIYDSDGADNVAGTSDDEPGLNGVRIYADLNNNGLNDVGEPSAVSDNSGAYRIYGFAAGIYTVRCDAFTLSGLAPTTTTSNTHTLAPYEQYSAADFGFHAVLAADEGGNIGDRLWLDADEDGVVDAGEALLGNVTVRLYYDADNSGALGPDDLLLASTVTNASGVYLFSGLNAGNYLVDVDEADADMPLGVELVSGGANGAGLHDVTLAPGATVTTADFGYNYTGSIGDTLFYDADQNGVQDIGESGVSGATVLLYEDSNADANLDIGEPILAVATTDANGLYSFGDLPAGSFIVKADEQTVAAPPTSPNAGTYGGMQGTAGTKRYVTLAAGQNYLLADIGFAEVAELEGTVFHDINHNGVFDPGETVLENVTVTLTGFDINNNPISLATTTDDEGEYGFLPPAGVYTIVYDTADADIPANLTDETTPTSITVTALSGEEIGGLNFGRDDRGIVGDLVWADVDGDGIRDASEPGLSGLTIVLYESDGVTFLASTLTDATGGYTFTGLADGDYVVEVLTDSLPDGYDTTPTGDPDAPLDSRSNATVAGGGSDLTNDFGYEPTIVLHTVSGTIFHDLNANDEIDVPAEALAGITVTARVDTDGDTVADQTFTTSTSGSGFYEFIAIPDGSDVVIAVDTGTLPSSAFVETIDPDASLDNSTAITVLDDVADQDFGYVQQLGSIAGTVVVGNGNGLADVGEAALGNVAITLLYAGADDVPGTGDDQTFNTTTNGAGDYSFTGLLPGLYQINETNPSGYSSLADADGFNADIITVLSAVGENEVNQDFEDAPNVIAGHLYVDTDGDGTQDPGEPDLINVDVVITDSSDVTQTVSTNGGGDWSATVAVGSATVNVEETDPNFTAVILNGYIQTEGTDPTVVNALAAQTVDAGNDGYFNPGSISGTVLADTDNDDDGDVPINGVMLTLKDSNGADIDSDAGTPGTQPTTATTALNGTYSFTGLFAGTYRVVETDPAGYLSVTANTVSPVAVTVGANTGNVNFVDEQVALLGNLVWHDADNDGVKNGGESGLDGVAIELLDGAGAAIDSDAGTPGVQPTTTTTAGGGLYNFANLPPGSYRLRIAAPPVAYPLSSTATSATDDQQDNDDNGIQSTPSAATLSPVIALAAGEVESTIDFGFTPVTGIYSITGQVRDDYDQDGNFSDNDQPVSGVTVRLYADTNDNGSFDGGDQLLSTTVTNGLGYYTFTDLPNGTYIVREVDPEGASSTADTSGGNDNLVLVALAGSNSTDNDFLDAVDPSGYAYDVVSGQIIAGGSISVNGPGAVTILMDGSSGQYSFITDGTPGSYTITYTPPPAYLIDPTRPVTAPSFDPTGGSNPTVLGSGENPLNAGYLTDATAGANAYYLTFDLAPGDPVIQNNNIPLRLKIPRRYVYWKDVTPGGGPNPGSNGDGDCFTDIVEYALNLNPASGVQSSPGFRGVRNPLTGNLDVSFDRVSGAPDDVTYTLMGLTNLTASPAGWTALSMVPSVTDNGDGTETVTYTDVESDPFFAAVSQGFVRLRIGLDEDLDTVVDMTANTPVFGWTRHTFGAECVMTGHPYLKNKNFCGTVDAVAGNALNVATSAGAESIVDQFTLGRQYFVEVYNGASAGHRFEIDEAASTDTIIALDLGNELNTQGSIPGSIVGSAVVIREHHTLNDLFPSEQFTATNSVSTADRIMPFNRTAGQFQIFWLFANGGSPRWVLSSDATLADQGARIIDCTEGWFTHPKGGAQEIVWHGMVRANPLACPLLAGPNFIGSGYPMDQSPTMRGMSVGVGFLASNNPATADQVLFWKGYTSTQSMAYFNHFLLSYGAMQQWTEVGNASLTNENNLAIFRTIAGCIYKMRTGLTGYVMPMPWTP